MAQWSQRRWWWWVVAVVAVVLLKSEPADSKLKPAETNDELGLGCSQYKLNNPSTFFRSLNLTMADIRIQISNQRKHFATSHTSRESELVYALFQCRNYLSTSDCVACFDTASLRIRNCSTVTGARIIYDGCFLRYETQAFYFEDTRPGNAAKCGNRTVHRKAAFNETLQGLLGDLAVATSRISGFFVATKRVFGAANTTIYTVAQCVETITPTGCQDCLRVAAGNLQNCIPYSEGRATDAGCFLRYSTAAFFPANQTILDITPFLKQGGSSKKKAVIWGVAGGVGLCLLLAALFLCYRSSRKPRPTRRAHILGSTELQGPVNYSYRDLKAATKQFNDEYKLGEGGFGDVYKGVLRNGNIVAVKKLAIGSARAKEDFNSEVRLICNVHHRNVIRLLGCSSKGPDLLLVYEYMTNGSLDDFLFGKRQGTLNWKQRFDIIFGTARGLAYLHDQFHVRIIHRDVKSSNILLDDEFQPKIADFGLARLLPEDQTHLSTRFAGTLGYTAPEYAIHGQLTEKVDIYSYGVVVLEIISGRRSNQVKIETSTTEYLLQDAWQLYESEMHMKLVDASLDPNEFKPEDVKKMIEIALMCTQSPASMRPTMSEVVVMLISDNSSTEQRRPNRPAFLDSDNRIVGSDISTSTGSSAAATNATVTLTEFTGR